MKYFTRKLIDAADVRHECGDMFLVERRALCRKTKGVGDVISDQNAILLISCKNAQDPDLARLAKKECHAQYRK
jgi:hypothetical protein